MLISDNIEYKNWKKTLPFKRRFNKFPFWWRSRTGRFWKCFRLIKALNTEALKSETSRKIAVSLIKEKLVEIRLMFLSASRIEKRNIIEVYMNVYSIRKYINIFPEIKCLITAARKNIY